jgi:RNA polymerase sigma factor (sigma-70 family)
MPPNRQPPRGDEAELFVSYNEELRRTVRGAVNTSPQNIEDACAFAWVQFLAYQPDRDRNWRGWMFRVAEHEAWRLHRKGRATSVELHEEWSNSGGWADRDTWDAVQQKHDLDEAVSILRGLPPRHREAAFLQASGYQYDDIALVTGNSRTTVSRLIRRANERIYDALAEQERAQRPLQGRAGRLDELENDPPKWLVRAIGRPPGRRAPAAALLQWRRAALLIDDYRADIGLRDPDEPIGSRPSDPNAVRRYELLTSAIERVAEARQPHRGRCHER